MKGNQVEAFADACQRAEGEHVDLEQAQLVEVVLVPGNDRARRHSSILDRGHGIQPVPRDDETARMLAHMARKADQFAGQGQGHADGAFCRVESGLADLLGGERPVPSAPGATRKGVERVAGQAHHLADIAQRAFRAIANHHRGQAGTVAAIAFVDVLDDLLAPLMLEIDIDIGRLVPLGADKSLDQKIDRLGIRGGDAQQVADRRVSGAAPPLAQDAALAREAHDVPDGQEIRRVVEPCDQGQFVLDQATDLLGHTLGIALARRLFDQPRQGLLRRLAARGRHRGIFVPQFIEVEIAARDDLEGPRDGRLMTAKEARHFIRAFQMPFGVRIEPPAGLPDRAFLANAGQDILQGPAFGVVLAHIAGGDQGDADSLRQSSEGGDAPGIVAAMEVMGGEVEAIPKGVAQGFQMGAEGRIGPGRRQRRDDLPLSPGDKILEVEPAFALRSPAFAERQQPAQAAIGRAVGRIAEQAGRVGEVEARADDEAQPGLFGGRMGAHDTGERIAVGDRDGAVAQFERPGNQFLGMRGAFQEAEIARHLQFGIAAHAKSPCMNQCGPPFPAASP